MLTRFLGTATPHPDTLPTAVANCGDSGAEDTEW